MIITIINQKGGVAKSSTVISIGSQLADLGKKVLIVDMDAQANTTSGIGITENMFDRTVYDLMVVKHISSKDIQNTIIKTCYDNLFCYQQTSHLAMRR